MSEGVICRSLNSKQTHFKILPKGFESEMLNLDSKCAQYFRKQAFMSYLSTNYEII